MIDPPPPPVTVIEQIDTEPKTDLEAIPGFSESDPNSEETSGKPIILVPSDLEAIPGFSESDPNSEETSGKPIILEKSPTIPSSAPTFDGTVNAFLTSSPANSINFTASVTSLIELLVSFEKWWSKKHSAESASSQGRSSQPSETDIVSIHLRMTHGPDHEFEEWVTDPDRLKHYIDIFNQPSSSVKPLQAIFEQKNGGQIIVDVSKGAQNNPQLEEILSYIPISPEKK